MRSSQSKTKPTASTDALVPVSETKAVINTTPYTPIPTTEEPRASAVTDHWYLTPDLYYMLSLVFFAAFMATVGYAFRN